MTVVVHAQRKDTLHRNVRYAQKYRSAVGFWQQVPKSISVQKAHSNEHASRSGRQGSVHHHAICSHPGKLEHKDAMWYVCYGCASMTVYRCPLVCKFRSKIVFVFHLNYFKLNIF